jgi:hypothetical protein
MSLEEIYRKFNTAHTVVEICSKFTAPSNNLSNKQNKHIAYEKRNILERWLVSNANNNIDADKKFVKELVHKKILSDEAATRTLREIKKNLLDSLACGIPEKITANLVLEKRITIHVNERKLTEPVTENLLARIQYLLSISSQNDVILMLLKYISMLSASQHWGLTRSHWVELYNLGVRNEAFASPVNSRLIEYPNTNYFSVFKSDSALRSCGDFFTADMFEYPGDWSINPPFIEDILYKTVKKVTSFLDMYNEPVTIFLLMPNWQDAEAIKILNESEYLVSAKKLPKNRYYFEDKNGNSFLSVVDVLYFVLSKNTNTEEIKMRTKKVINQIICANNAPST